MTDKKELEIPGQSSGFTLKEMDEITKYEEAGLPGIIDVSDEKLMAAFNMRLDGIRFLEIAKTLGLKKVQVMYLAKKYNWHQRRMEFLEDFEMEMKERVLEEKIRSKGFLMKAMHVFRKKMGKKFDRYLASSEDAIGEAIDFKEIGNYIKMMEAVSQIDAAGLAKDPNSNPLVGINPGDGVNIKKLSDNSIEITPRQKSHAEMLAELAKSKRESKNNPENK